MNTDNEGLQLARMVYHNWTDSKQYRDESFTETEEMDALEDKARSAVIETEQAAFISGFKRGMCIMAQLSN